MRYGAAGFVCSPETKKPDPQMKNGRSEGQQNGIGLKRRKDRDYQPTWRMRSRMSAL